MTTPSITFPTTQIGTRFRAILREAIGESKFEEMCNLNWTTHMAVGPKFCWSHEYVDANIYMMQAWIEVIGKDIDLQDMGQLTAWNEAWIKARLCEYELVTPH